MHFKYSGIFCLIILVLFFQTVEAKRAMTVDDLFGMGRVSDPQVSPDGKWIAYTVTNYSMETNKSNSDLWLVSIDGQTVKQLTTSEKGDSQSRWKPDGSQLAFISSRNGTPQIFLINLKGGEANPLTNISTGASVPLWSPDGKFLVFVSEVYPDLKTDAENAARDKELEKSPVKARLVDNLLYRHWNAWREGKRQHIFIVDAASGVFRDLTPGDFDSPTIALGGTNDINFSPDSKELAFTRNADPMVAISTNNDIFTVPITGGEVKKITDNPANDNNPVYSPDGKYIAYRAMARPGFEADEDDIILYERATGKKINLTEKYDRSVGEIIFSPDSKTIYFNAEDYGRQKIYAISIKTSEVKTVVDKNFSNQLQITPDGKTLVFRLQTAVLPFEVFKIDVTGQNLIQLTYTNKLRLAELALQPIEDFKFKSFDGIEVHGLLVKPPFFEAGKKYPMVYLIHGGPQGAWSDDFHYRWNSQMFAAPGYVVALVNFRGSKGYGQKFCDMVSQNWGGGPYQDLMSGLDYLTATYNFIDKDKVVAAGASYGGYMINWIATQTGRFKALISHAGAFDATSKYGSTEELWFPEWEFNGTPYENPELYEKWSPSTYAKNLKKFKTPTLVIHGANDFRVPEAQGFQMFTALQRNGVPSQFLHFPDEDHFIQKPQNAKLWWKTVYNWIQKWVNQ
jgi:dipeptidyl aminopeptidase/acylaminoacyl peptidase